MNTSIAHEIALKLTSARRVLLVCHRRPDPDSLGSAVSMGAFLEAKKISHSYYCPTPFPPEAVFFGINPDQKSVRAEEIMSAFDVVCVFDASDLKHAGLDSLDTHGPRPFIIVFDHHATNTRFGNINAIDIACASTTELMVHFFEVLRFPLSARVSAWLLAGLLVDTDHFMNPATSASSLTTAGVLIARGVSLPSVRQFLFERREIGTLHLIGEVLSRLRKNSHYEVAISYITDEDLRRYKVGQDDLDGIANILNVVGDAKAMILLYAFNGIIKGSFRTTREEVNVGYLAELLGGGGHRKAAGFRIKGGLRIEGDCVTVL